jgi:hypothetical protein
MFGGERTWRLWGDLLGSIQTGESAMQRLYGVGSDPRLVADEPNPEAWR